MTDREAQGSLTDCTASQLSSRIRQGEVTAADVAVAHLERIEALEPIYHTLTSRRSDEDVLADARAADLDLQNGRIRGWLHGIPLAVKDLVDAKGMPTSLGFLPIDTAPIAVDDEPFVGRLREAGAIFVGKSNSPEFGLGSHTYNTVAPTTRNIADATRSAGGSSGGAAVAVAAGMMPVADGSDLMGSLRNPPGWNGVLGMRPSPGVVGGAGGERESDFSVSGPIARCVADLALVLSVMASTDYSSATQSPLPRQPRVAWLGDLGGLPFEPRILDACEGAARRWSADVRSIEVAADVALHPDRLWSTWLTTRQDEIGPWLAEAFTEEQIATMKPEAQWELNGYRALTEKQRSDAAAARRAMRTSIDRLFDDFDLLMMPTAQVWPFPAEWPWPAEVNGVAMDTYHRWMQVTTLATLAGLPAVAAPADTNADGLHIGLQVIGRRGGDAELLAWAAEAEARDCFHVASPTSAVTAAAARRLPR